jgi:undecaprenyl-diphosphatase
VGALDPIAVALSWLGTGGAVWLALALVMALLWRRPALLVWVGAADLIAYLAAEGLRDGIGRARPPLAFPEIKTLVPLPRNPSFPSGHATISFACALVLAAAARARRNRALLLALALLIALSRIYAGVHYPLDALGGAALGTAIGLLLVTAARATERRLRTGPLDLFGRFDQARGDYPQRRQESDPDPDSAPVGG